MQNKKISQKNANGRDTPHNSLLSNGLRPVMTVRHQRGKQSKV
jgi:hypothetical protein